MYVQMDVAWPLVVTSTHIMSAKHEYVHTLLILNAWMHVGSRASLVERGCLEAWCQVAGRRNGADP